MSVSFSLWRNIKKIKKKVGKWNLRRKYKPLMDEQESELQCSKYNQIKESPFHSLKTKGRTKNYFYLYSYNQDIEREPLPRIAILFDKNARMLHLQRFNTELYLFLDVKKSTETKTIYKGWYYESLKVKLTFNFEKGKLKMSIKVNGVWQVIDEYYFH